MGSLMAGWDSNVPDSKAVKYQRNRSLTREQIDTYWNSKKQTDENTKVGSEEAPRAKESEKRYERSRTLPLTNNKGSLLDKETDDDEASLEKMILKNGWWMGTSSAFLNERPVIASSEEAGDKKYASQFHVAGSDASKAHHTRTSISTS